MDSVILQADRVCAGYGSQEVLRSVDFTIGPKELCGIIGPNGAGKTTLLRTLYGILPVSSGAVRYEDRDISRLSVRERLAAGISYVAQERNVFPGLSVGDNIDLAVSVLTRGWTDGQRRQRKEIVYDLFPRLRERQRQAVGLMSGGEQRMVAISLGMIGKPRVLLLDEPTTGLAPVVVHQLMDAIRSFSAEEGVATVVVEQNVLSLLSVVDTICIVKDGRTTRYDGDPSSIRDKDIWEYL
ncbi:ATP-binding cassette domain-containing protein [Bradyrhizobium sp. CSA207]|uniref:branched-chain amino acid ABC transporter ATP-binding protein n=1 Tax=Bradyrhizobium sp. CSA207 TaxID=2698826 RepID=UPI0023B04FF0|nr:ABC transporter ATP-binding protein [Bradyrhizobium sp. CSA207]MDE5444328.1 ATP-binding cassette domain-containing protein [Bradyrhizobium sp. CSA207]